MANTIDSRNPIVHSMLGAFWGAQDKLAEADTEIARAMMLDPQLTASYAVRSLLMIKKNDYDKAFSDMTQAVTLTPTNYELVLAKAEISAIRGDWSAAVADYAQAYCLGEGDAMSKLTISIFKKTRHFWSVPERETLRNQFKSDIGYHVENVEAGFCLFHLYWKIGRPKTAIAALVSAAQLFPHSKSYSEPVRMELRRMLDQLPPDMKEAKEVKEVMGRLL